MLVLDILLDEFYCLRGSRLDGIFERFWVAIEYVKSVPREAAVVVTYNTPIENAARFDVAMALSSTPIVMLNTANVIVIISHTDASASCEPVIQRGVQNRRRGPRFTDLDRY